MEGTKGYEEGRSEEEMREGEEYRRGREIAVEVNLQ